MLRDPAATHVVPRALATRASAARAAVVARAVTPLVGGALALHREFARSAPPNGWTGGDAVVDAVPLARCADQLLASAQLLAESVRRVGGVICARRADATATEPAPASGAIGEARHDALRRLLAGEHALALGLRRAIATCDAHADDHTAGCLEEVLDEVRRQQAVLSGLLNGGDGSRQRSSTPTEPH